MEGTRSPLKVVQTPPRLRFCLRQASPSLNSCQMSSDQYPGFHEDLLHQGEVLLGHVLHTYIGGFGCGIVAAWESTSKI
jgi:hypothetical protein